MIKAEIVGDSLSPQGNRLISVLCTFPRIILSEINTHRMLSKNTSSSRAIPFNKMVESVKTNPFIPIAWQKEHSGMQGSEYFTNIDEIKEKEMYWLTARYSAVNMAQKLSNHHTTKQLCNRLLEPFMWCTVLVTGNKESFDNMFDLRCPSYEFDTLEKGKLVFKSWKEAIRECSNISKTFTDNDLKNLENTTVLEKLSKNKGQAEIHFMDLAEKMYDAMNESIPKQLKAGEWHIPFENKIHIDGFQGIQFTLKDGSTEYHETKWITEVKVKISVAMAARTSYTVVGDEKEVNYERMVELHDRLIAQNPPHSSPMEHCARAMSNEEYYSSIRGQVDSKIDVDGFINIEGHTNLNVFGWCRNFKGFIPYRHIIESL